MSSLHNSVWSSFFLFSYLIINIVDNLCLPRKIVEQNLHFPLCSLETCEVTKEIEQRSTWMCNSTTIIYYSEELLWFSFLSGPEELAFVFITYLFLYWLVKYFCFHFSYQPAFSEIQSFFFFFVFFCFGLRHFLSMYSFWLVQSGYIGNVTQKMSMLNPLV